jgi:hypothetical protein
VRDGFFGAIGGGGVEHELAIGRDGDFRIAEVKGWFGE